MRKIDELANEKFDGDTFKAIENLVINKDSDFDSYINDLTKKEATHAFICMYTDRTDKISEEKFRG